MSHASEGASLTAGLDTDTARILLHCLSGMRDQFSFARLAQAGISSGWRCLVVNAGNGSVARWLSEAVAPRGTVIATTSMPEYLSRPKRITVATPDFDPATLARGPFELIHARLPVSSNRTPGDLVTALVSRLTPGGVLVVESCGDQAGVLLSSPEPMATALYERYQTALRQVLSAEWDAAWSAAELPGVFVRAGLVGVDVALHARSWPGGTPGTKLHAVLLAGLHDRLVTAGLTDDELHSLRRIVADPQALMLSRPVLSVVGRRQRSSAA